MDDIKKKTEELEKLFLDQLINLLKSAKIEVAPAKLSTKEFLALQPFVSIEEINAKMKLFGQTHPDFNVVYEQFTSSSDTVETKKILDQIQRIIKESGPTAALQSIGGK